MSNLENNTLKLNEILIKAQSLPSGGDTEVVPLSATENKTYTAPSGKAYSPVTVNVPTPSFETEEVTITPTKSQQVKTPSKDGYSKVTVNAIPSEYIIPSGSQTLVSNDTYNVTNLSSVTVNVPIPSFETEELTVTPSESQQIKTPTKDGFSKVTVDAISNTYVGSGVTRQGATIITPTKSSQVAVNSGVYTSGTIKVDPIPSNYIETNGTIVLSQNGTGFDVKKYAFADVFVSSGGLPSGISAIDIGNITVSSDFTTTRQTFNHKLGVVPDFMMVWATSNVATTYSMLCAIRSSVMAWRSSAYNLHMAYHGNSTTSVTWTNSNNTSYGVSNMTATTFQLASASSSYYWRAGTYRYIAIKF